MHLLKIPSMAELEAAGANATTLLDQVEWDTRDALLWCRDRREIRLLAARLKHIRRRRREHGG